ncbi:MAG: iron chelate uptake ABC transporter family permease subunit [Nitrospira sp.]|nr:iron chelate uptake ABC transporter family permease subunit [Nitrospira sp.]
MKQGLVLSALVGFVIVSAMTALVIGSVPLSLETIARALIRAVTGIGGGDVPAAHQAIVVHLRLPRVLLACLVGGTLALAGAVLQGLFRNPMADPGLIGVSSGGALGAVLAMVLGLASQSMWALPVLAFIGAGLATWVIFLLASSHGRTPLGMLLLAGLAVSAFLTAMTSLLLSLAKNIYVMREVLFWLMGGLEGRGWLHLWVAAVPALIAGGALSWFAQDLNVLAASGEEGARSLGLDMDRLKRWLLILTALMVGAVVSVSGIIGFVGLIVPHIARLVVGPDHRILFPTVALGGAVLLIWADLLTRTLVPAQELRLGVVAAFVGAPFFISLLRRHRAQSEAI